MVTILYHKWLKIASTCFCEHSACYQYSKILRGLTLFKKHNGLFEIDKGSKPTQRKRTWWSLATLSNNILVSYKASFHLIKSHIYLGNWKRENILWKQTFQEWIPTHLRTQHTAIPSFKLGNLLSTNSSLKIPSYVQSVEDYNYQSTGTWQWNQCSLSPSLNKPQQTHPKTPQDSSQIKICLATL